jgi:hypothetical protein
MRINEATSALMLLALLAGLLSLAFGLPTRRADELANTVLDDLLAAQIGVLLVALGIAFVAESVRSAADIVDDQSLLLAWPWALIIASLSWVLATVIGPFEATRMLAILLHDWLPAVVDGRPSAEVIRGDRRIGAALGEVVDRVRAVADRRGYLGLPGASARRVRRDPTLFRRRFTRRSAGDSARQ